MSDHRVLRLAIAFVALVVCALVAYIGTPIPSNTGNGQPGIGIVQVGGKLYANDNVHFYYGPTATNGIFTNQVEIYTGSGGWNATSNHRYGWATVNMGAVVLKSPKGERVLDLYADYGTARTPVFKNIPWKSGQPIPLAMRLRASNGLVYTIALSAIEGDFYSTQLPMVPCIGDHKC